MIEFYLPLRAVHITCAIATVILFTLRGLLMIAASPLLGNPVLRWTPIVVDTVLLGTAVVLTTIVRQYPFTTPWLTVKVLLLLVYIVLGSIALKRGRTRRTRVVAFAAALLTVGFLVTVARTHDPLGLFGGPGR